MEETRKQNTNFWAANLEAADLRDAKIWRTTFTLANLRRVDLSGALVS